MKIVVLDGYTENPGDISWEPLEALGEVTVYDRTSYEESPLIAERIGDAEVVVINKTPISKETIDKCPNIKTIAVLATGYNVVDYEYAKSKGMKVIALTNLKHSNAQESRHHTGLKLYQICDVVLDNQGCLGDASVFIPEINRNIAATSTALGAVILQSVVISAVEKMIAENFIPEVFSSSNLDEGDEINKEILARYKSVIKPL